MVESQEGEWEYLLLKNFIIIFKLQISKDSSVYRKITEQNMEE